MINMTFTGLQQAYATGELTPASLLDSLQQREQSCAEHNVWLYRLSEAELAPYLAALAVKDPASHPLWGIPFAIKDNIDLAGIPTTAGCEAFTYVPAQSATVVQQLIDAGAIPLGKTSLDQFATGLNGTRTERGPCRNSVDPTYISGGSSAGSAVAVGLGLASFSLGTDTAGSGRVPAGFNNLVGLKPSVGLLSATGMVPACRSLDCISIFAANCDDANQVMACAEGYDGRDGYSRANVYANRARQYGYRSGTVRVGVIPEAQLQFFGDQAYARAYQATLSQLQAQGFDCVEIDYAPFDATARLLYEGPWVAERYLAAQSLIERQPEAIHPVVRQIIEPGGLPAATALFGAQYRLKELSQHCMAQLEQVDCLLTPTAGRLFTVDEMLAEPVLYNSQLGYYTNFVNLLDLAAVAVPTTFTEAGLPFGVTLVGPCFSDRALLSIANRIQQCLPLPVAAQDYAQPELSTHRVSDNRTIELLVCGAHLSGQPLNWQLTERGARLLEVTTTADQYRLYALAGGPLPRPALVADETESGQAIEVEIWSIDSTELGSFADAIPAPLGLGRVQLADGRRVCGFICAQGGLSDAQEITRFGGWRHWLAETAAPA